MVASSHGSPIDSFAILKQDKSIDGNRFKTRKRLMRPVSECAVGFFRLFRLSFMKARSPEDRHGGHL